MTEAQLTRKFLKRWRERYPHAVAFKINDRTTSGVPDTAITQGGRTLWIEFKRDNHRMTELQRTTLLKLAKASEGRAFLVVFNTQDKSIVIYDPGRGEASAALHQTYPSIDAAITFLMAAFEIGL